MRPHEIQTETGNDKTESQHKLKGFGLREEAKYNCAGLLRDDDDASNSTQDADYPSSTTEPFGLLE
jgi:hypothetical protein